MRKVIDVATGEVSEKPLSERQIAQRSAARRGAEDREVLAQQKDMEREFDLKALETATPDEIGRIIKRLLDA